ARNRSNRPEALPTGSPEASSGVEGERRPRPDSAHTRQRGPRPSGWPRVPRHRRGRPRGADACGNRSAHRLDGRGAPRYSLGRMISEDEATLATRDGARLEARISLPSAPAGGVVICHPHPLYGGDMDNPVVVRVAEVCRELGLATLRDRKSTRLNSSHDQISYAVFCLKKKNK